MASFEEHITQAKRNLAFLEKINSGCNEHWDWQVTACFYTAVHLANAHIARKINGHFRTHSQVKQALNPEVQLSPTKWNEIHYKAYVKLMNLSRRSRYLCHDNTNDSSESCFLTYDVHFIKSLKNLDQLLHFFTTEYEIQFNTSYINCILLNQGETIHFQKV